MRGSPVRGALKTTVTSPFSSVSRYSVNLRRRKIDSASGPFSHSTNRACSASCPLATRPIHTRVSSPATASDGTQPAYPKRSYSREHIGRVKVSPSELSSSPARDARGRHPVLEGRPKSLLHGHRPSRPVCRTEFGRYTLPAVHFSAELPRYVSAYHSRVDT